ncbi:hypothetical protein [Sabulicella glaciei]|uniref:Ribosomal subunit interface protein n=1 Tax=Sabulicella glaciei TaxID=2984948 RepID=A0ABT3NPQ1_9PROT|nr:hypothetical protein [Roseococcus sp. MDT2-1-1]MCW8084134.1 hypothetical protein [Roseococcus sp. MDT2-1-1]
MQIQINTDDGVRGSEDFTQRLAEEIQRALGRFSDQITRIEVHLGDANSPKKGGDNDMRCAMEARPTGQKPVAVTHHAATPHEAAQGATRKLRALLDTQLGKRTEVKGAPTIRDGALDL